MHLSEHRVGVFPRTTEKSPVIYKNEKHWVTYNEIEYDETNFIQIGSAFEKKQKINTGMIGKAPSKLMNQKKLIDFTTERSEEHTSELQSRGHLVCRLLLEKKKTK